MKSTRGDELISAWCEERLSADDARELNDWLRTSEEARSRFRDEAKLHGILHAAANAIAIEQVAGQSAPSLRPVVLPSSPAWAWRQALGVAIGLLAGVLSVTAVWAYSVKSLVATSQPLSALRNGSFQSIESRVPRGFPTEAGIWSGDELIAVERIAPELRERQRMLRFVAALPDSADPSARAIACDLFQLVDLQELRPLREEQQDGVLEFSAEFLDERPQNTNPSVTFFCQLYLFRGDPESVHYRWPSMISEAISSGSAQSTTLGDSGWHEVTARCLVPEEADFAVVHLAAMPNLRVPMPDGLFVDQARLVFKSQPVLPVRAVRGTVSTEASLGKRMGARE